MMPFVHTKFASHGLYHYKSLAPYWGLVEGYKSGVVSKEEYTFEYEKMLSRLDPNMVVEELGINAVLMCYESPSDFCHRHLVSKWLREEIGIEIVEFGVSTSPSQVELEFEF